MDISGSAQAGTEVKGISQVSTVAKPDQATSETVQPQRQQRQIEGTEEAAAPTISREETEELVEALEELTETLQTKLNFSINETTNDIVVKVIEKESDTVIKQFPPEELLELQEKMMDLAGFLFDTDV